MRMFVRLIVGVGAFLGTVLLAGACSSSSDQEPAGTDPDTPGAVETGDTGDASNTDDTAGDGATASAGTATNAAGEDGDVDREFPNIVAVEFSQQGAGPYTFDVTVSSPYDTPERYADAWRILSDTGEVLGIRELDHDHQNEQPFTRSLSGVEIPSNVIELTIEGRDLVNGWGGQTVKITLNQSG